MAAFQNVSCEEVHFDPVTAEMLTKPLKFMIQSTFLSLRLQIAAVVCDSNTDYFVLEVNNH